MKILITIFFLSFPVFLFSQYYDVDSIKRPGGYSSTTDSFQFCGKNFKVERNCDGKDSPRCYISYKNMNGLLALNGDYLTWSESPNVELAATIYNQLISITGINEKIVKQENIDCLILGAKPIACTYFETESKDGYKRNFITAYGIVNGRVVSIEFNSASKINKANKLRSAFQEIISWK